VWYVRIMNYVFVGVPFTSNGKVSGVATHVWKDGATLILAFNLREKHPLALH
jgi:hypothetical protein